jgi:hypothetical protein
MKNILIVKQPDGQLALWSTAVKGFVLIDGTPEGVMEYLVRHATFKIEREVERVVDALAAGEPPYRILFNWDQAAESAG